MGKNKMTTHVFIVNDQTFKYHLEYLFAGTGVGNRDNKGVKKNYKYVDFNNSSHSTLYSNKKHATEAGLVSMMADCCRMRIGDNVLFYLQATSQQEGRFFGIFKVEGNPFLDRDGRYLENDLGKNLTFRIKIKPSEVYSKGVTEWQALDEIRNIPCPCQMLWSLIYRKLKGNRGNTMITIYESERLIDLIRRENNNQQINIQNNQRFSYDAHSNSITLINTNYTYQGNMETINILPRLIEKYNNNKAHEAHLQMYIAQHLGLGTNASLDNALGSRGQNIEWIGNEVSCGVGMQRIDLMFSSIVSETQRLLCPIELKAVPAYSGITNQISRYIDWIEQYYIPNRISTIQPILICKKGNVLSQEFHQFNLKIHPKGILPLKYIEYEVNNNNIVFNTVSY